MGTFRRGGAAAKAGGRRLSLTQLLLGAGVLVVFLMVQGLGYWQGAHTAVGFGTAGWAPADGSAGEGPPGRGSKAHHSGDATAARALAEQGSAGQFQFSGAAFAGHVERELDANATAGLCERGKPRLPGTPARVCQQTYCLWSRVLRADVDLTFNILQLLPENVNPEHCPQAQGGQAGGPAGTPPLVSLVLVVGGDDALAAETLLQLFRTAHEAPSAEFVIVPAGGGSPPPEGGTLVAAMAARLEAFFGTRITQLDPSAQAASGPGEERRWGAAQRGLEAAVGTYAVVVQPGTFVLRGWLHALLATFEANPSAAVVGPLILEHEKAVLEAGGLLHSDGTVSMLGAGAPLVPDLLYLRRVDFVGGGCVALRREEVLAAGGFDHRLSRYFGDVDLALSVQHRGLHVLMQPLSAVASKLRSYNTGEGVLPAGAAGAAGAQGNAMQQFQNDAQLLAGKWQAALQARFCPRTAAQQPGAGPVMAPGRGGASGGPHLLWIDDTVPTPDKDSGSVRCLALMRILLQEGYRISFQPHWDSDNTYNLRVAAAGVRVLPASNMYLPSASAPLVVEPGKLIEPPRQASLAGLKRPDGTCKYDGFVVARRGNYNQTYRLLDEACPGVPQIFDTVDLHFLREVRAELERRGLAHLSRPQDIIRWLESAAPALAKQYADVALLLQRKQNELDLIAHATATLVVSDDEVQVIRHYLPEVAPRVHLVSNIHEVPSAEQHQGAPCAARHGLLFVGNYNHKPNTDAVEFLVRHVLPRIRRKLPEHLRKKVQTHLVGAGVLEGPAADMVAKNQRFVQFHGYLSDELLHMLYSSVKVAVAPLTTGAGVKGKVNQAMKYGVPVVATKIAVEGMHTRDGLDCMVAETAEEFAEKVVQVYQDCQLWERLSQGGLTNLKQHFSTESARGPMLRVLTNVGLPPPSTQGPAVCGPRKPADAAAATAAASSGQAAAGAATGGRGAATQGAAQVSAGAVSANGAGAAAATAAASATASQAAAVTQPVMASGAAAGGAVA